MSLDIQTIRKGIFEWATEASGLPVIWNRPNDPRPKRPYVSLSFLSGPVRIGIPEDRVDPNTGKQIVLYQYELNISVIVYGADKFTTLATATEMQQSLAVPLVLENLLKSGLTVFEDGPIQDVSALLESGYEERAQMDVRFGLCSTQDVEESSGLIETVELLGEVEGTDTIDVGPIEIEKP